jgi:cell division protein FtsB
MSTLDTVLLVVGLGLIGWSLWALAGVVRRLSTLVAKQALQIAQLERDVKDARALQIAQLERDVKDARALARKRLVAGRSGR